MVNRKWRPKMLMAGHWSTGLKINPPSTAERLAILQL